MTSRELLTKTLAFDHPDRIAMTLPPPYPNDIRHIRIDPDPDRPDTNWEEVGGGRWEYTDEWGNTWARVEGHSKGEVARGAVEDWAQLDDLPLPDYDRPDRYDTARAQCAAETEKFRAGGIPGFPFNVARKMRRLDQFLMDLALEPDNVERLLALVEKRMDNAIRRLAEAGVDGIVFCEDWGTQDRLLVSPAMWRRFFKPGFQRLCATAHERGLYVLMHSCGCIYEAMDDMIECGIDCFQFDQPQLYGIDWLADRFSGRATFWCPVDIQNTLQTRDPARIEDDARRMIERFGEKGGGFIAGYYGDNVSIGIDPSVQDVACRAFVKYGAPAIWSELEAALPAASIP